MRAPIDVTGKAVRGESVSNREQAEAMHARMKERVEAVIALSIVLVAAEALHRRETLARRWPVGIRWTHGLRWPGWRPTRPLLSRTRRPGGTSPPA